MVITVLEATVGSDQADRLEQVYQENVRQLDAGIVQTFLIRSAREPDRWQIVTVWQSREALAAMRASGQTPRGVVMFREVGAEPTLTVFDVLAHAAA